MATTNMRIVIRRDTALNWMNNGTVVLLAGEQGYETDTRKMKVGDGVSMYKDLPYFAGGITDIDKDTIIMDAAGVISLNSDSVIGDLGTAENVKAYVDAQDAALAAAISTETIDRETADVALGARIDALTETSENGDTTLAASLSDSVDALVAADEFEKSERMTADGTLQTQISLVNSELNGSIADVANDLDLFKEQTTAEFDAQGNLIVALQAADTVEAVAREAADAALGAQISDLQDMDTTLGSQINDVNARIDALETNDHPSVSDIADSITTGDDAIIAMLSDSVDALEAADAAISAVADAAAPNDVGAGYGGVISSGGTVNAALLELETAVNAKYGENDNPSFGTVTASFIEGALKGDVWNDAGDTKVLENSTATLTGNVVGNVTGDVTGNLTGDVTGDVTGDLTGGIVGVVDPTLNADVSATASDVQDDIANAGTSVDDAIGELKTAVVELQDQLAALVASIKV